MIGGANNNDDGTNGGEGAAYVYYGSSSGVTNHPIANATYSCTGPPDCSALDNPNNEASGLYGESVAGGQDLNADGFADIIVGARANDDGTNGDEGAVYIHYGASAGITGHAMANAIYSCTGPPDCGVLGNPYNEASGRFGAWVGD